MQYFASDLKVGNRAFIDIVSWKNDGWIVASSGYRDSLPSHYEYNHYMSTTKSSII